MQECATLYTIVDLYIELTRALGGRTKPERPERFGIHTPLLLIRAAVYLGTVDGRPMTATNLADYLGMPRPTVVRNLHMLVRRGAVERRDNHYCTPRRRIEEIRRSDFSDLVKLVRAASVRLKTPR